MQKRAVNVLLIMSVLILILNAVLLFKYTGQAIQTNYGTINLTIKGRVCGDGTCESGENCSSCAADCGSCAVVEEGGGGAPSGGGGGGVSGPKGEFSVEPELINILVKQGESFKTSVKVKNTGKIDLFFEPTLSPSLEGIIFLSDNSFILKPKEEKEIFLTFVSVDENPEVYTGNLRIRTIYLTKKVQIIYNIESRKVLFDVSLHTPPKYKEIFAGEDLLLQVTLFNLGEIGKTNVSLEYIIKDFEGDVMIKQDEIVEVEKQISFSKFIKLPSNIKLGEYVAIVQVRYGASLGSSSDIFQVIEEEPEVTKLLSNKYFLIFFIVLILFLILIFLWVYEKKRLDKIHQSEKKRLDKISKKIKHVRGRREGVSKGISIIREKLRSKLETLEEAYVSGYVSKESYKKGKERIRKASK